MAKQTMETRYSHIFISSRCHHLKQDADFPLSRASDGGRSRACHSKPKVPLIKFSLTQLPAEWQGTHSLKHWLRGRAINSAGFACIFYFHSIATDGTTSPVSICTIWTPQQQPPVTLGHSRWKTVIQLINGALLFCCIIFCLLCHIFSAFYYFLLLPSKYHLFCAPYQPPQ